MGMEKGGVNGLRGQKQDQTSIVFMLLGSLCVYTVIPALLQCTQIQDCLDKGSPAASSTVLITERQWEL